MMLCSLVLLTLCIGFAPSDSFVLQPFKYMKSSQIFATELSDSNLDGRILSTEDVPVGKDRKAVNFGMPRIIPPGKLGDDWLLWYHARDDKIAADVVKLSTGRILFATSKDGLTNWKHDIDSPVLGPSKELGDWFLFDAEHVGLGDVINPGAKAQSKFAVQGGMFLMYTFGGSSSALSIDGGANEVKGTKMEIGVAVSQDGVHWSRVEGPSPYGAIVEAGKENSFDSLFVGWPTVLEVNTEYRMYYSTYNALAKKYVICLATATDGLLKWVKRGPVFSGSENTKSGAVCFDDRGASRRHIVRLDDGSYKMWYEGISSSGEHSIGLATSNDGYNWERYADEPVFSRSENSAAWDGGGVGSPHVLWFPETKRWRMYYIGNPAGTTGVGGEDGTIETGLGVCESIDELGTKFIRIK